MQEKGIDSFRFDEGEKKTLEEGQPPPVCSKTGDYAKETNGRGRDKSGIRGRHNLALGRNR